MGSTTQGKRAVRRSRRRGRPLTIPGFARLPAPLRRWLAQEFGPVARTLVAAPVLAVLLCSIPALALAYQFLPIRHVDVGRGNDGFYLRGVFAPEQGAGTDFRWLGDGNEIVVPAAQANSDWTASLRLSGERPVGIAAPSVAILIGGQIVARFDTIQAFKDYSFTFHRAALPEGDLTLTIDTPTFDPPGDADNRPLGVAIDEFTLTPAHSGPGQPFLPPLGHLATMLALLIGFAGLLGRLGARAGVVAGIVSGALGLLLVGQLRQPDIAARYLTGLLLIVIAIALALLGLRPLVRRLYRAGGVTLGDREEQILCGIFCFGAAAHLAGVFFPNFQAHDLTFQVHRVEDILRGNFLLSAISSEWGYQRTPYPPALYIIAAPFAALATAINGDTALPLRLLPPLLDATSVFLIFYLLRRCTVPDPAPLLAAFCYTLIPATYQLLWWGFYSNLFGQWATLAVLTLAIAHYGDLTRPRFFLALTGLLGLALLSHPGTFVLTVALMPLLALILAFNPPPDPATDRPGSRRGSLAIVAALALGGAIVYALYYRHFTGLVLEQATGLLDGMPDAANAANAANDRGWEDEYIRNRLFVLPFGLYVVATLVMGLRLLFARGQERTIGWLLTAVMLIAVLFGGVHVLVGVWVRYFVFVSPALAIGAGLTLAWVAARGRLGRGVAIFALTYCTGTSLLFWLAATAGGQRSAYP